VIPADNRLLDLLACCAVAVDEYASGRPALAEAAWLEASFVASGLFPYLSRPDRAAWVITCASRPGRGGDRAVLWNALDAAAIAVSASLEGHRELALVIWPGARAAAEPLPFAWRGALLALLDSALMPEAAL
jgi:hypothetical protein